MQTGHLWRWAQRIVLLPILLGAGSGSLSVAQVSDQGFYAPRSDWSSFRGGDLNISAFVFRDLNRNGIYDVEDRPMARIAVALTAPNGRRSVELSNISGFANFRMSVLDRSAPVRDPGTYAFEPYVPSGWVLTTDNPQQRGEFVVLPGSVADIVLKEPLDPIGLAPVLTISGRIRLEGRGADAPPPQVSITSPSGSTEEVVVGDDGHFAVDARPGKWLLRIAGQNGQAVEREISVADAPVRMSDISLDQEVSSPAPMASVVGFDDITQTGLAEVPSGVGGLHWKNMVVTTQTFYEGPGYVNIIRSGNYLGYNSSGHPATVSHPDPFDFLGGYFGVAWPSADGEILEVRGWRGDVLVYEDEVPLSSLGPVWFDADYRAITRLELATRHYWQFVSDDLQFRIVKPYLAR